MRDIRYLEDGKSIFSDFNVFGFFCCSFIVQNEICGGMVFEVVRKSEFPVFNHIIVAQKIISLKVIGCEYIVTCILQVDQFGKLLAEFFLKKGNRRLINQLICLKEVKEITFFLIEF